MITFLIILCIILIFIVIRLIRIKYKLEKYTQELLNNYSEQEDEIYKFYLKVVHMNKFLENNRLNVAFQSDDEIGQYFRDIKDLTKQLETNFAYEK